jgi:hypothetical protein
MLFRNTRIGMRGEPGSEEMNATDMWRANGSPPNKRPGDWKDSKQAREFASFLTGESEGENFPDVDSRKKGGAGGGGDTWLPWQLAFAYAKYLSPAFHAWVNRAAREKMTRGGGAPPAAAAAVPSLDPSSVLALLHEQQQTNRLLVASIASTREEAEEATTSAKAAEAKADAAATSAKSAEAKAEEARLLAELAAEEASKTRAEAMGRRRDLPIRQDGWRFCEEVSRANELPWIGDGSLTVLNIVKGAGLLDDTTMVAYAGLRGRLAATLSPKCVSFIQSKLAAASGSLRAHGYTIRDGQMVKLIHGAKGTAYVRAQMLRAAALGEQPQLDLRRPLIEPEREPLARGPVRLVKPAG